MKKNLDKLIADLKAVEGVRIYNLNKITGNLKIGSASPKGKELTIIVETVVGDSYIDLKKAPKITPENFLRVAEVY